MTDVNDNVPQPTLPAYWPSIEENALASSVVVTVSAEDGDPDTVLRYSIVAGNPQSLFNIDQFSGNNVSRRINSLYRDQ